MLRRCFLPLVAGLTLGLLGCMSTKQSAGTPQTSYQPAAGPQDAAAVDQALEELLDELPPETLAALLQDQAPPPRSRIQSQPRGDAELEAMIDALSPEQRAALLEQLLASP